MTYNSSNVFGIFKSRKIAPDLPMDNSVNSMISQESEESTCRICSETSSKSNVLISPCKCKGSLKFIHEECLKTWLVSQEGELDDRKCEICNTPFVMEFSTSKGCDPGNCCEEGFKFCIFTPLLLGIFGLLIYIMYMLLSNYSESPEDNSYYLFLITICLIINVIILAMLIHFFKKICFLDSIFHWKILDQTFEEEEDESSELKEINTKNEVFFVPRTVILHGKRSKTPVLRPSLTPILDRRRTVAFACNDNTVLSVSSHDPVIRMRNESLFSTSSLN